MTRALVLGGGGLVGSAVARALARRGVQTVTMAHGQGPGAFELADAPAVSRLVREAEAHIVVLAAAYANVDGCEADPETSARINVEGTLAAARATVAGGGHFVWFSTDYVFDGRDGPYDEESAPAPVCVYGRQKLAVERALAEEEGGRWLVVRTTGVYGCEGARKNFVLRLVDRVRSGGAVTVPADQIGTPTYVEDLAAFVGPMALERLSGIWHVAGRDVVARDALAREALSAFDLDPGRVETCATNDLGQRAARPLIAGLRTDRLAGWARRLPVGLAEGLTALRREEGVISS